MPHRYIDSHFWGALSPPGILSLFTRTLSNIVRSVAMVFTPRNTYPVPENILVFRTLTTFLSFISRAKPIQPTDNLRSLKLLEHDSVALKISDAFAQLAGISQCDVLAVAPNPNFAENLNLMTSFSSTPTPTGKASTLPIAQSSGSVMSTLKGIAKWISYHFVFSMNDRIEDPSTYSGGPTPTIVSVEPPADINGRTAFDYMVSLEDNW